MLRRLIRWPGKIAIAIAFVAAVLALSWAILFWWQWLSLPWDSRMAVATAVPTIALVGGIWWLWWRLPKRQVRRLDTPINDPKARADTEDNFRKTVGQALGGAAVLIGAGLAYLQFSQQQRAAYDQFTKQQQTASEQILEQHQASENSLKASQNLMISNQVSKGFEQLANKDSLVMRLGGIYALEGVMNTSPEYHQPVLEGLCAFVRDSTTGKVGNNPATDVQAALTVIGRRKKGSGLVNLASVKVPGANLSNADLTGANLSNADLSNANLTRVILSNADLSRANLSNADLTGADLSRANLSNADLTGALLSRADLSNADLTGAHLSRADLGNADLSLAGLSRADLSLADLYGAHLSHAVLSGADLSGAILSRADLSDAELDYANLSRANLSDAELSRANLSRANLSGADLSNAHDLIQDQLNHACGEPMALPPGPSLDKPCPPPSPQAPAASKP